MRRLLFALLVIPACMGSEPANDPIDEVGLSDGKTDGANPTECESREVLVLLNEVRDSEALAETGVNTRAANALVKYRNGDDAEFQTDDDNLFETLEEVDEVAYVGRATFNQLVDAVATACTAPAADAYAQARDVNLHKITFPEGTVAPDDYEYPDGGEFNLNGTEFWQKWSGGHNPTYDFNEGTDKGRLCQQAAAIRFEAVMADAPRELVQLKEETNWDGSFYNWNDDYSGPGAYGDASTARLWAWQTYLIKWISQTAADGSCYLPTRDMVIQAATNCLATGASGSGEIQGCRN